MALLPDSALVPALLSATEDILIVAERDAPIGAWKIATWNEAAQRVFGVSAAEAVGAPLTRFVTGPLPLDAPEAGQWRSAEGVAAVRPDGHVLPPQTEVRSILAPDGAALGLVVRARAIPSLNAGARLPESDATSDRLNLALAAARLGDWSWNALTDAVSVSERAAEIFGISPREPITWTEMRRLLHPNDRESARLAVERALASRGHYSIEYRVLHGGRERWVVASGRGRYGRTGEVLGMYGVVQEITSDRLLVRLDDAVRPLVNPEEVTGTAARMLGEHLEVDRAVYATVEADQDTFTLAGSYVRRAPSPLGRYRLRQFGEPCLQLMRAGSAFVVEDSELDSRIRFDDRAIYAMLSVRAAIFVPISKSGHLVALMAVWTVAARTWSASEVELAQRVASRCWESIERARVERERAGLLEAAESANRAKDLFLAMLGHELRNPLAPIATALSLMQLQSPATFQRERTVIERQVDHLTRLVDDLLDVSRIARAKVLLKLERVNVAEVVARAIEVASPLLEKHAHALSVHVPPSLTLEADAARLTQILSNLLSNAGKYTPPGGHISVSAALEGEQVVLSVRDNGMGIAPDALPRVFDLFVQGPQALDRALGGLGLGLTIVRSLVERHGGSVAAHSPGLDRGSEFVVRLPQHQPPGSSPVASTPKDAARDGRSAASDVRVLVVDDNVDAAEMLADALAIQGCEVQVAHDAPGALELATAASFDACLLDIGLPVIDGYELAARLRELPTVRDARLIAVTGYGQPSDRERALAAGFHHHLVKPLDLETLRSVIGSAR